MDNETADAPVKTIYDNEVTMMYKWAYYYGLPSHLLISLRSESGDLELKSFEPLSTFIGRLLAVGQTISEIYKLAKDLNDQITTRDIIMAYYTNVRGSADVIPEINTVQTMLTRQPGEYETLSDIENAYRAWLGEIAREQKLEEKRLSAIYDAQDELNSVRKAIEELDIRDRILISPLNVLSTVLSYRPKIVAEDRAVTLFDGIDLFNNAVVSRYVPYVAYNDNNGNTVYRVYESLDDEDRPDYDAIVIPPNKSRQNNTFYITVWLGDPQGNYRELLGNAPKASFINVTYNLSNNYMSVEAPEKTKHQDLDEAALALNRLEETFPELAFGNGFERKVKGDFDMWNLDIDETAFLEMILSEPVMNIYLYIEEKEKPYALKELLTVNYQSVFSGEQDFGVTTQTETRNIENPASVSVTLTRKKMNNVNPVQYIDNDGAIQFIQYSSDTPYIHVTINQGENRNAVDSFVLIFNLLMEYYRANKEDVLRVYRQKMGKELARLDALLDQQRGFAELAEAAPRPVTTTATIAKKTTKAAAKGGKMSKIKRLQELAPDLIISNYAGLCQLPQQPVIIRDEDVPAWTKDLVRGSDKNKQVMPFPTGPGETPRWNFTCPSDTDPFPGVKVNSLENKDKYPYIPCCFKSDQMEPGKNSTYQDYIAGRKTKLGRGAKGDKKITTSRFLDPGGRGKLPSVMGDILGENDEDLELLRYGVIRSPNSLFHCVAIALQDKGYNALRTETEREQYVTGWRQSLVDKINIALLRQEMYDYTEEDIITMLNDETIFFDPTLLYRAIEEIFNINIYVFTVDPLIEGAGLLELPRHKIFHSRPVRLVRRTVMIAKMYKTRADKLDYPQCELICDYDNSTKSIHRALFGTKITQLCHHILTETMRTLTWDLAVEQPENRDKTIEPVFPVYSNLYYHVDHLELFQTPAVSQFVDSNGKMRSLVLALPEDRFLTVATIPSQPENLPISGDIYGIPGELAINIFGQPSGKYLDPYGRVIGLWFPIMGVTFGEFAYIIPEEGYEDVPLGIYSPFVSSGHNVTPRLSKLKRDLNIIVQIVRWAYETVRVNDENITPQSFAAQRMAVNNDPVIDSADYYDLSAIPRKFPQGGIEELEALAPTLFNQGRIIMYDNIFAEKIVAMLQDYDDLQMGVPKIVPEYISGYYQSPDDFRQIGNSKIFMKEEDLQAWITNTRSIEDYSDYFSIRTTISTDIFDVLTPILYKDEVGRIYIVQNIEGGTKAKAMTVANEWIINEINIGPSPEVSTADLPNLTYGISPDSKLVLIEDNRIDDSDYVKILYYGTALDKERGKNLAYAAILEIL